MRTINSFGDRIQPGNYRVHSRFSQAVNFVRGNQMVCIVGPQIGGGPINIVVSGLDFDSVEGLRVDEEFFFCDGLALPKKPLYDSGLPAGGIDQNRLQRGLFKLETLLLEHSHPKGLAFLIYPDRRRHFSSDFEKALADRLSIGAQALSQDDIETGARLMRSVGFGLTPSGDDFLAGWMWGLHVGRKATGRNFSSEINKIFKSTKGTNPLCSAFLRCAHEGRFFEPLRDLVAAVTLGDEKPLVHSAKKLLASGETSGTDTAAGFLLALRQIYARIPNKELLTIGTHCDIVTTGENSSVER